MDDKDEVEVKTSFGSIKAAGNMVIVIIVVVCASGALGYMIRDHDMRTAERSQDTRKQVTELKEAMAEQTYVLTLDERQRKELRLDMPDSLRRKTGR